MIFTHARIDSDGLVIALLNSALMSVNEREAGIVAAPPQDAPPGELWRMGASGEWGLIADLRGKVFVSPVSGEKFTITRALETAPDGYILEGA